MTDPYLWLTALHVIAFAAWMAAMWYLPRLFVYHAAEPVGSPVSERFKVMERRLMRTIGTPAMIVTLVLGVTLASLGDWWTAGWLHGKLLLVVLMTAAHGVFIGQIKKFARDERPHGERWYRVVNEVPTVLFIGIVVLAIVKPL